MLPLSLVEDSVLESLQEHFHKPILSVRGGYIEAVLIGEQHGLPHPAGLVLFSDAVHLHQMVDEASLSLVQVEVLLQDLPALFHVIVGPSVRERLPDRKAEQLQLAVYLAELVEKLLGESPLLVERGVQTHACEGLDADLALVRFANGLVGDLLGGKLESAVKVGFVLCLKLGRECTNRRLERIQRPCPGRRRDMSQYCRREVQERPELG